MLLQSKHNIHFVLFPSFPRRTNCSTKHKVCTESACSTPAGLPGQPTSGELQRLRAEPVGSVDGNPGSCSYPCAEVCAQACSAHNALRVSKK